MELVRDMASTVFNPQAVEPTLPNMNTIASVVGSGLVAGAASMYDTLQDKAAEIGRKLRQPPTPKRKRVKPVVEAVEEEEEEEVEENPTEVTADGFWTTPIKYKKKIKNQLPKIKKKKVHFK